MDAENRRIPIGNSLMRTVLICTLGSLRGVFIPISIVILPVGEPRLLRVGVHRLEVESTVMSDEALEALVVVSGKIIDGEAAKAGTYRTQLILVDIRQVVGGIVDG